MCIRDSPKISVALPAMVMAHATEILERRIRLSDSPADMGSSSQVVTSARTLSLVESATGVMRVVRLVSASTGLAARRAGQGSEPWLTFT